MIVLDTNVLSEMFKPAPDARVMASLDRQEMETLYISAVTQAELKYGVYRLPEGARREQLFSGILEVLALLEGRVLPFDAAAADQLALAAAKPEKLGTKAVAPDAYIAATALAMGFAVATRSRKHFESMGVTVINPWEESFRPCFGPLAWLSAQKLRRAVCGRVTDE
jgi:predicted nucleic acid-binding protein